MSSLKVYPSLTVSQLISSLIGLLSLYALFGRAKQTVASARTKSNTIVKTVSSRFSSGARSSRGNQTLAAGDPFAGQVTSDLALQPPVVENEDVSASTETLEQDAGAVVLVSGDVEVSGASGDSESGAVPLPVAVPVLPKSESATPDETRVAVAEPPSSSST